MCEVLLRIRRSVRDFIRQEISNPEKILSWPGHKTGCSNTVFPVVPLVKKIEVGPSPSRKGFVREKKSVICQVCCGSIVEEREFEKNDLPIPSY